jgi:hypothetical protein
MHKELDERSDLQCCDSTQLPLHKIDPCDQRRKGVIETVLGRLMQLLDVALGHQTSWTARSPVSRIGRHRPG